MILETFEEFNKNYCVYIYFDSRKAGTYVFDNLTFDYEPIYVGKGKSDRPKRHLSLYNKSKTTMRFHQKLKSIIKSGHEPMFKIIRKDLSESEAFAEEIRLINLIGRVENVGTLLNLTNGGDGQSGYKHREESKLKTSQSLLNNKEWQEYMKSEEFSKKVSKGLMGHVGYGIGVPRTDDVKDKIRHSVTGDKNHFYNKTHSDELKGQMSIRNTSKGNPNSKVYIIEQDAKEIRFEGRLELKDYINKHNLDNDLKGPNKVSLDGLLNRGISKNFRLISINRP